MERDKKGQFKATTGSTKYKNIQFKGNRMGEHRKRMMLKMDIEVIPNGFVVHHVDGNKLNNNVDNLLLLTHSEQNLLHAKDRKTCNKGLTVKGSLKIHDLIKKATISRGKGYILRCKPIYDMREKGMTITNIAKDCNITRSTVSKRIIDYKNLINK